MEESHAVTRSLGAMAVLHLIDSLAAGGAQTSLQAMMELPEAANHHLVALRETTGSISIRSERVHICRSPSRFSLRPLFLISRLISAHKVEILHCHLLRSQVFGLFLRQCFFRKLKLVFHEHGQIFGSNDNRPIENAIYAAIIRFCAPRVDHFLAGSGSARAALIATARRIRDKSSIVLAPIRDLTRAPVVDSGLRAALRIAPKTFVVGFAGRIIAGKGWRDLVNALNQLGSERDVFLLVAGDGPDRAQLLEALRMSALADRHHWLGVQSEMSGFYRALNCMVVPSHREAQGLVQIEAQSLGVPVVAANVPGMRETLADEENALLFEVQNASALARQIDRLISDPPFREHLIAAGKVNAARFGAGEFLCRLEAVYDRLGAHTR